MRQLLTSKPPLLLPEDGRFIPALAASQRFCEMWIMDYVNQIDLESQTQFAAITVALGRRAAFCCLPRDGRHARRLEGRFQHGLHLPRSGPAPRGALCRLGHAALSGGVPARGHSKGGNLAVYAAAFCPAALQERIAAVYNNDGPGFDAEVIALPGYQRICARVQTFVPQSSIVGMLLEHEEAYTIIHSTGDGFGQHNLLYLGGAARPLRYARDRHDGSRFLDRTLKQWLAGLEPEPARADDRHGLPHAVRNERRDAA